MQKDLPEIRKDFEAMFLASPFKDLAPDSPVYMAMYGSFMAGYGQCQKDIIQQYKDKEKKA